MVNDQLGGTGDVSNNVPIPSSRNGKRKTIENRVTMILPTVVKLRYEINEYQQARNQGEWLNDGEEFSRRVQASS